MNAMLDASRQLLMPSGPRSIAIPSAYTEIAREMRIMIYKELHVRH